MDIGDCVKLKCDEDTKPIKFRIRSFSHDGRASCQVMPKSGKYPKRRNCYLFEIEDIESYEVAK